jgi:glycosyltransferase involved in cell wall biosynthesis
MRTVLAVLHERIPGGATLSLLRIVPLLERRGWRFVFWVCRPSPLADRLAAQGYDVHGEQRPVSYSVRALRLPPGPRARLRALPPYLRSLRGLVSSLRPDLIHLNSLSTLAEGAALWTSGARTVVHVHEMVPATAKGTAARLAVRMVGDDAIAVSTACAESLAVGGWRPRLVYECAPVPSDPPPRPPERGRGVVVGTIGVVSRRKGSDTFVQAARIVAAREPEIEFQLVGAPTDPLDAEWAETVLTDAEAVGVRHIPRADVPATLPHWDVFVLPSRRDPFPISMLEAMGHGLAPIGARVDGIAEQLAGNAGLLVEPDDPAALAAAILRLCGDPDLRQRLGANARRRVLSEFTLDQQADGVERAYLAALRP